MRNILSMAADATVIGVAMLIEWILTVHNAFDTRAGWFVFGMAFALSVAPFGTHIEHMAAQYVMRILQN